MTRIPITKDGLSLLRKQAKAAVKAGNSPLSQYSGLVFVLDGKEIPFTDILRDAGGAAQSGGKNVHDELRQYLRDEAPWLAQQRRAIVDAPLGREPIDDDPDRRGPPGSRANQFYDLHNRPHIMHRAREHHDALGDVEGALDGSQLQQQLQGGRGPIGGQTRFILAKNVAPKKR